MRYVIEETEAFKILARRATAADAAHRQQFKTLPAPYKQLADQVSSLPR